MKKHLIQFSFILSLISLATTFLINIQIAKHYLNADGKTRALFGLNELLTYGYQYYVGVLGLMAFLIAIFSTAPLNKKIIAAVLGLLSIACVFARIWRLFI